MEAPGRDPGLAGFTQGPRDSEPVLILSLSFVVPLSSQVTSQVTPSRMTPLPLLDPGHEANARPQLAVSWGSVALSPGSRDAIKDELSHFLFSAGGQLWVRRILVRQDTVSSFLACV